MASPGTMTRYDLVGVKEDISDIISNISPTDTPFQSMIGSETIDNTLYQWQEDSLLAVGSNAMVEGAAANASVQQSTVLRNNGTQIITKTASASGTADRVKKYGRAKELSYQLGMRSAELKRDLENILVGVGVTQVLVPGSNTVARQMAGCQVQIVGNVTTVTGALTETVILQAAQACYAAGAMPSTLMIKPGDALKIASFKASGRTTFVENTARKLVNAVDVYVSPFGDLKVVKNRFQKPTDALVFNPNMWKKLVLRPYFRETLAKVGDSTQVMIVGEFSLKHKNYGATGLITALT